MSSRTLLDSVHDEKHLRITDDDPFQRSWIKAILDGKHDVEIRALGPPAGIAQLVLRHMMNGRINEKTWGTANQWSEAPKVYTRAITNEWAAFPEGVLPAKFRFEAVSNITNNIANSLTNL